MKISELILQLQNVMKEYGDLNVMYWNDDCTDLRNVEYVNFINAKDSYCEIV